MNQQSSIVRGHAPKYRCSNPVCRKIFDDRVSAQKCCELQEPVYQWTHKADFQSTETRASIEVQAEKQSDLDLV